MPITIRIALRNLLEHKAKSIIVGSLLALGILILIMGNAFLEASNIGIRRSFTENYTGDIIISGRANGPVSIFGVQSMGGNEATPIIPDYERVLAKVQAHDGIQAWTAMTSGMGVYMQDADKASLLDGAEADDGDGPGSLFAFFFGIDASNYWQLFRQLEMVDGTFLQPGQPGIMISSDNRQAIERLRRESIQIGDEILIQGFSSSGMRLRSLPLIGVFKPLADSVAPKEIAYMDINNVRVINHMTVGANEGYQLSGNETAMLELTDFDSLFSNDSFAVEETMGSVQAFDVDSVLGDTSRRESLNLADTGAWHSLLLRVVDPLQTSLIIAELNQWFAAEGLAVTAGGWKVAAGPYAASVDTLRVTFIILVIILAVVVIIIIMNTLIVSIIERSGEIGTMRAIGGSKQFIRRLFMAETSVLSVFFGLIGIGLALLINGLLWLLRIPASNEILSVVFGGGYLRPIITAGSIIGSLILIVVVGLAAHLYPVTVALRIQPVRAMQSE
ncbi:MAG: hypothetical protein A2087_09065 [Spirochaetes bacterium GWD1_61_31]|nr:MAG: hypothetical protein A2Y37_04585 [Spirochaetes bacterium GWB1_60_80]OHD33062.1 MAG: hypothetical protein A2004_07450 [Spirochaetes bacterium GWC1_61_12]OHD44363.1 MAG: hypothetical protein A2087_09065 [Spirochaetes bacterium GWD1_61_31]OHD46896.1 MAG: hypothetical protein A2Y35_01020 [Spirochaetes bacterium GWE1_60_18]OHD61136.1 MAG: hypothetical protein A2Y32_09655 [Spirochaetes bacterium GWF1_60_12]HAX37557.1 hypothetical protein [Spirochaetaceae bacterium]